MGQANDIYTILRARGERLREHPEIHFVLYGDGKEDAIPRRSQPPAPRQPDLRGRGAEDEDACCGGHVGSLPRHLSGHPRLPHDLPEQGLRPHGRGRATALVIDGVIRDVIEASGGGIYVPPRTMRDWRKVIRELADDPARVKRMGEQARAYLVQNFDRRDKLSETLDLFQRIAS